MQESQTRDTSWVAQKGGMETVAGLATSRGFAAGEVYLALRGGRIAIPERAIAPDDADGEVLRYRTAQKSAKAQIDKMLDDLRQDGGDDSLMVLASHLEIINDVSFSARIEKCIYDNRICAESAVRRVTDEVRQIFMRMKDKYMRERVKDVDDVESRILRILMDRDDNPFAYLVKPSIIVADELAPSDTAALKKDLVLGFATDDGSTTSHVALLARALGIPAVTGLADISSRVKSGDFVLLDGTNGAVTINPDASTRAAFDQMVEHERQLAEFLAEDSSGAGVLKSGERIVLSANSQPGVDLCDLKRFGAEGIGLYRTEYLWLKSNDEPSEDEQFEAYAAAVRAAGELGGGARVTFRTLDIGGDKLPRMMMQREANPFLGCRSIRYLLRHRDVLRTQLRAILRASAIGKAAVMFPMVSDVREMVEAKSELALAMRSLREDGIPFDEHIQCGAMVETPSAALNAVRLASECDFFSIGTNDLVQYTMAADRGNGNVANLYQPTNPAVLRLVQMTAKAASDAGIGCGVCGESASDPVLGFLWVALGVGELSMSAGFLPAQRRILKALSKCDADELAAYVNGFLDVRTAEEIYDFCLRFLLAKVPRFEDIQSFFTRAQTV